MCFHIHLSFLNFDGSYVGLIFKVRTEFSTFCTDCLTKAENALSPVVDYARWRRQWRFVEHNLWPSYYCLKKSAQPSVC